MAPIVKVADGVGDGSAAALPPHAIVERRNRIAASRFTTGTLNSGYCIRLAVAATIFLTS
jgi:hypothetical protein